MVIGKCIVHQGQKREDGGAKTKGKDQKGEVNFWLANTRGEAM